MMEMSIEEHMAQLKKLKSFHNGSYGASINFAIDIMRKYQTIELIRDREKYTDLEPAKAYELINEVLEDGKID